MRRLWPILAGILVLSASPAALADTQAFTDVGPGNPYYAAVEDVAVTHRLMSGLPNDQTFNGDLPLRRIDLALTLANFIKEVEVQTGITLSDSEVSLYAFSDISDPSELATVTNLANNYDLFNLIPSSLLDPRDFQPDRPVTRYEAAAIFDSLMQLMEQKGLVTAVHDTDPYDPTHNPFTDLSPLDWAYKPVLDVVRRYQIMAGTTDATFAGNEVLTRYEFASIAARAFAVIRQEAAGEIVIRRPEADAQEEIVYNEFQGLDPLTISVGGLFSSSGFSSAGGNGSLSWVGYTPMPWSQSARLISPEVAAYHLSNLFQTFDSQNQDPNTGLEIYQSNQVAENLAIASLKVGLIGGPPSPIQWEIFADPALLAGQIVAVPTASGSQIITGLGGATAASGIAAGVGAMVGGTIYDRTPEGALDVTVEGGLAYLRPFTPAIEPLLSGVSPIVRATIDSHLFLGQTSAIELPEIQIFMLPGAPTGIPRSEGTAQAATGVPMNLTPTSGMLLGGGLGLSF